MNELQDEHGRQVRAVTLADVVRAYDDREKARNLEALISARLEGVREDADERRTLSVAITARIATEQHLEDLLGQARHEALGRVVNIPSLACGHPECVVGFPCKRVHPTREERQDFADAHFEGLHDGLPREGCPECERVRNRTQ